MKAVIVEIKDKHAIVLNKNGEFSKIKNRREYRVGNEIETGSLLSINRFMTGRMAYVAAALLFVVALGGAAYSYNMPYSYINIDINPSIEITVNIYDRIIRTQALNKDGDKLLAAGSYANKNFEDGVSGILASAAKTGYFADDSKNAVMFTVSGKDQQKVEQIDDKIKDIASKETEKVGTGTEVIVEKVTLDKHDEAEKMGISPGKLSLLEKLKEYEPQATANEVKDKPVKEIEKRIKENIEKNKKDSQNKAGGNTGTGPNMGASYGKSGVYDRNAVIGSKNSKTGKTGESDSDGKMVNGQNDRNGDKGGIFKGKAPLPGNSREQGIWQGYGRNGSGIGTKDSDKDSNSNNKNSGIKNSNDKSSNNKNSNNNNSNNNNSNNKNSNNNSSGKGWPNSGRQDKGGGYLDDRTFDKDYDRNDWKKMRD